MIFKKCWHQLADHWQSESSRQQFHLCHWVSHGILQWSLKKTWVNIYIHTRNKYSVKFIRINIGIHDLLTQLCQYWSSYRQHHNRVILAECKSLDSASMINLYCFIFETQKSMSLVAYWLWNLYYYQVSNSY